MNLPAPLRTRAARVRTLVFELAPSAAERITWGAISFYHPSRGGPIKGSICQLVARDDDLRLDFPLGELMEDVHGVLEGEPGRKGKRFVVLRPREPRIGVLRDLLNASLDRPDKPKRL